MNNQQHNSQPDLKQFPVTVMLIASFVGLFAWQIMTGVDANSPAGEDLIQWGANWLNLSVTHEPWRLLTAGFLHIGFIHLMFNSFAIYYFGQVAEQIFGKIKFLALFLLAVVGGNVLNCYLAWQNVLENGTLPSLSAGASGGVMGIGAALVICALFNIRPQGIILNLQSLVMIMIFNLSFGFFVSGIDNAGHIGGAVTGALLAIICAVAWRTPTIVQSILYWLVVFAICAGFFWVWQGIHIEINQLLLESPTT